MTEAAPERRRRKRPPPCLCLGYWFPHRHKSKYCLDYPGDKNEQYWLDHPANKHRGHFCA